MANISQNIYLILGERMSTANIWQKVLEQIDDTILKVKKKFTCVLLKMLFLFHYFNKIGMDSFLTCYFTCHIFISQSISSENIHDFATFILHDS